MNGTPSILGILLIDDNVEWSRTVVDLIEKSLPHSNRRVRWEGTLKAGREALKEFHADAIWLDLDLPDARPPQTLATIAQLRAECSMCPIYVFSDHFDKLNPMKDSLAMDCMMAGAHMTSTKDTEEVMGLIRGLLFRSLRLTRDAHLKKKGTIGALADGGAMDRATAMQQYAEDSATPC